MKENRPIILRKEKRIKTDFYKETQPRNGWKLVGKSIDNSKTKKRTTLLGIEPRISGSVDQRLIHWATESSDKK